MLIIQTIIVLKLLVNFNDSMTSKTEGMQWPKSTTPAGSVDPNEHDTFRVYNGTVYLNEIPIASVGSGILWTGGYYFTSTQKITPTKPLSKCANGWTLIWSDYDVGGSYNDWDWVATMIPKNAAQYGSLHTALMAGYATATQVVINAKTFTYTDTQLTGVDINNSQNVGNNNADAVLRMVVEFYG